MSRTGQASIFYESRNPLPEQKRLAVAKAPIADNLAAMITTVEATIDEKGTVRLLEPVAVSKRKRAFVMILDEDAPIEIPEITQLSEAALATDWNRPEEDAAWSSLQKA